MNLAFLSGEYPPQPGGVGDYTHQLAVALRQRGHAVAVLTIQGGRLLAYAPPPGAAPGEEEPRQILGAHTGLNWSPRCWPAVVAALDQLRPSWLHIQYQTGAYNMRPGINFLPWRLRSLPGRPMVAVTFHDLRVPYLFPKVGPLRQWVNTRLAADSDAVIATNPSDATQLRALIPQPSALSPQHFALSAQHSALSTQHSSLSTLPGALSTQHSALIPHPSSLSTLPGALSTQHSALSTQLALSPQLIPIGSNIPVAPPPGYTPAAWRARLGAPPDTLLVAYFGLLSPSKGVDLLVEALATLRRPWRLLLVGGGASVPSDLAHAQTVRARIAALGLAARVIETGHAEAAAVSAHLLAADLVALPFRDGASFRRGSLLAALAHGCVVVTTQPADPADAALLAPAAELVPPNDPTALAAALARLAADAPARAARAAAATTLAAHFGWATIALRHEQLYVR